MIITIEGKDYPLNYDLGFIRRLNTLSGLSQDGIEPRGAINLTMPFLLAGDVATIVDYILCANKELTQSKVDSYLEEVAKNDETGEKLEKTIDEILKSIEEGMFTRLPFKKAKKEMKKNQVKSRKA